MVKKTITYTDYDGVERTEDFYFNLTKSELIKMEFSKRGGLVKMLQRIAAAKDAPEIMRVFDEIIQKSYGIKAPDGKGFIKTKEAYEEFLASPAYDIFFTELISDEKVAADFVNMLVPEEAKQNKSAIPAPPLV